MAIRREPGSEDAEADRQYDFLIGKDKKKRNNKKLASLLEKIGEDHNVRVQLPGPKALEAFERFSYLGEKFPDNPDLPHHLKSLLDWLNMATITDDFTDDLARKQWRGRIPVRKDLAAIISNDEQINRLLPFLVGTALFEFTDENRLRKHILSCAIGLQIIKNKLGPEVVPEGELSSLLKVIADYQTISLEEKLDLAQRLEQFVIKVLETISKKFPKE